MARPREGFARFELRGRRSTFARSSIDFVAGAALSHGQVSISWQAQHFRKVECRFRGRRSTFASTLCELGDGKMQKTLALCVNWASGLCANHLGCDACTEAVSERSRNGLGTGSETGPLARPREGFARFELRGRRSTFARSSIDFVAGAALSQGQVSISWQAQHFRKVKCQIRGRRSTFARSSTKFVAGASLSQGQVQNLWQVQHFCKVKCKICGTRSTFARSSTDFVAGAAL